jgi:hypothetical protein
MRRLSCSGGLWWTRVDVEILLKIGRPDDGQAPEHINRRLIRPQGDTGGTKHRTLREAMRTAERQSRWSKPITRELVRCH